MKKIINAILSYALFWVMYFLGVYIFKIRNRIKVEGRHNLPQGSRILYLSNHQTLIDSLLIGINVISLKDLAFRQKRIPYNAPDKNNFFSHRIGKHFIRLLKNIPVQRDLRSPKAIERQIRSFCKILQDNNLVLFFEGTRTRNGQIGECKQGIALTILQAKPDYVIPITLIGVQPIMPISSGFNYRKIYFGHRGKMIIGKPIDFNDILRSSTEESDKVKRICRRVKIHAELDYHPEKENPLS